MNAPDVSHAELISASDKLDKIIDILGIGLKAHGDPQEAITAFRAAHKGLCAQLEEIAAHFVNHDDYDDPVHIVYVVAKAVQAIRVLGAP